jgi:redox-sensitive bicupin YhaK (pirin superfamily)
MFRKSSAAMMMPVKLIVKQGITNPFGDHRTVKQAFPSAIPSKQSDPFLMCDFFEMNETKAQDEDDFPIGWHPHRGMDIATYLRKGIGRHGDSLGTRETFDAPGMQWMSVGSGVVKYILSIILYFIFKLFTSLIISFYLLLGTRGGWSF